MRNTSAVTPEGTHKLNIAIQRIKRNVQLPLVTGITQTVLFPVPPLPQMQASVIIPVKNEAVHIVKTLDALRKQVDENNNPLPFALYEILLLANNCTDDTYAVVKNYGEQYPMFQLHVAEVTLEKKIAHIGTVRRMLMDEAFRRHGQNGYDGVILSTDGDTEADERWIVNTLREMGSGCDAVGGRILTRQVSCSSKRYYLQDTTYRYLSARLEALIDPADNDPASCHFQCFGASMAVRCSAYHKAGRLPVIPFLEDEAFSRALYRIDAKVKKSAHVKVYTSSRTNGRVKVGLSVHLQHLQHMQTEGIAQYVESVSTLIQKWRMKRQLRECWRLRKDKKVLPPSLTYLTSTIGISPKWLITEMDISMYFGELWEKVEHKMYSGQWRQNQKAVSIVTAIEELRSCLKD